MSNLTVSPSLVTKQGDSPDVFIIAEIGINHNGDLDVAKKLIDQSKAAGCDAVKFQKRTIEVVYSADILDQPRDSPWGETQRDQKNGLEFGRPEYDEIDRYCDEVGIIWFASAWDIPSQQFLRTYDLPYNKIASAMATHKTFIREVAREKKTTFISTGMCSLEDVDQVVAIFREENCPFVLLHTVSTYPAKESDLNLAVMKTLRDRYQCSVGYSGHEPSVSPSVIAAALGARVIERHVTLDRAMYGSDQSASLEPAGLINLVTTIRKVSVCTGDGQKRILDSEQEVAKKLRYWE